MTIKDKPALIWWGIVFFLTIILHSFVLGSFLAGIINGTIITVSFYLLFLIVNSAYHLLKYIWRKINA